MYAQQHPVFWGVDMAVWSLAPPSTRAHKSITLAQISRWKHSNLHWK